MNSMKSTFITLSKKSGAVNCKNFYPISIMRNVTKEILQVIMLRIRNKKQLEISTEQYGIMKKDKGTKNANFLFCMLGEQAIQMHQTM